VTIETSTRIWREGHQYIAHALPLDISSSGQTPDSARSALRQAIQIFVATARDMGTLDVILEECGYTEDRDGWHAPVIVTEACEWIAV
jgi:predicted RNase H-like HicB family nuclease